MAQEQAQFDGTLAKEKSHEVGVIASVHWFDIPNGLEVTEDIDNYTLGEVKVVDGKRVVAKATAETKTEDAVLIAAVERQYVNLAPYAGLDAFYNAKGEHAVVVHLTRPLQFETSAFTGDLVIGDVVAWDGKKFAKFVASSPDLSEGEKTSAPAKFTVVAGKEDVTHTLIAGKETVILEFYK